MGYRFNTKLKTNFANCNNCDTVHFWKVTQ